MKMIEMAEGKEIHILKIVWLILGDSFSEDRPKLYYEICRFWEGLSHTDKKYRVLKSKINNFLPLKKIIFGTILWTPCMAFIYSDHFRIYGESSITCATIA